MPAPWKKSYDKPRQHLKKQTHRFSDKGLSGQSYDFSSSHVWMWELDHKESWTLKNWCFWTVVLDKTLESPLDSTEVQPVNPEENQPWIFIRRTEAEAEVPILGTPMWKANSLEKILMLGKIEGRRKRGDREWDDWSASATQWTWVWTNFRSQWKRSLVRCSPWGHRVRQAWATDQQQSDGLRSKEWHCQFLGLFVAVISRTTVRARTTSPPRDSRPLTSYSFLTGAP